MAKLNKVLIDTNVLIYMYENKKDIFDFAEIVIPDAKFYILDKVYQELEKVFKKKPIKLKNIQKYLQKLENVKKIQKIKVPEDLAEKNRTVDRLLIYYSKEYLVYTNDKELKKKINEKRRRVLVLREKGVYLN